MAAAPSARRRTGCAMRWATSADTEPPKTRIRHLSKGQNVRLGLVLALAHRPEVVILDDPVLGLDPIMRKEFLRDLVTYLQAERVTVFFSSHLLYEIEPVADAIVILDRGKVVRQAATEELRAQVKRLLAPVDGLHGESEHVAHGAASFVLARSEGTRVSFAPPGRLV